LKNGVSEAIKSALIGEENLDLLKETAEISSRKDDAIQKVVYVLSM
jgi:hypothetical protein